MLKSGDLLHIGYYEYGQAFTGSYRGIRYRVAREPLKNVRYIPVDKRGEAHLKLSLWQEPYSFDYTPDDLIEHRLFSYSAQGLEEIIDAINCRVQEGEHT